MGKGKKGGAGKKQGKKAPSGGGGHHDKKRDERREKQRLRKEERLREWHDPKWKQDFLRFEAQLKVQGLRIQDMTGDGNCLFRSICDQLEGSPEQHRATRRAVVQFLRMYEEQFAPFVYDQTFDDYCNDMATDGEWGGNMELQAASLGYKVNIVIHQLDQPRWEIINFPAHQKTIHLSYHNGEHYSSVHAREGSKLPSVMAGSEKKEEALVQKGASEQRTAPTKKVAEPATRPVAGTVPEEVLIVMGATDCDDVDMVWQTLVENLYDVQAAISYILLLQETNDRHSMSNDNNRRDTAQKDGNRNGLDGDGDDDDDDGAGGREEDYGMIDGSLGDDSGSAPHNSNSYDYATKKHVARKEKKVDPQLEQLAHAILALEGRKLSNSQRKDLNRLKKLAVQKGVRVEDYHLPKKAPKQPGSSKAAGKTDEDEEAEIDALLATVKNLGALKI